MKEAKRSELKVRTKPHLHPARQGDTIVEVWREGKRVATIYGSLEGLHIIGEGFAPESAQAAFYLDINGEHGMVIPLLGPDEKCPWCAGKGNVDATNLTGVERIACPVCARDEAAFGDLN